MSLQSRLADFITAVGADIKALQVGAVREAYTFSMAGALTTKVGPHRVYLESGYTLESVRASVGTAPSGGSVEVDVNKNGTTIFGTQANRPIITTGTNTDLAGAASVTTFVAGDYITVDVDTVTAPAADLTVVVRLRRTS